jgi:glycosyltransferase involved in cell wall biosynthesis
VTAFATSGAFGESGGLRIAVVLTQAGVGGTEAQGALLVRGMLERGHDVEVLILNSRPQMAQNFGGARVTVLEPLRLGRRLGPLGQTVATARLWRRLAFGRFDVVHAMMARAHVLAPLLVPRHGRPAKVVSWRRNVGAHSGSALYDLLERLAARRSDVIVANSTVVRDYWRDRRLHKPRDGYRVVANALEDWRFEPVKPAQLSLAAHHLVTVGNLRPVKGHHDLIMAAAAVRDKGYDVGVVILGEGQLEGQLTSYSRSLGVPLNIVRGVSDTRPYLTASTVYVHPSHQEGSSNAVAEAMAQGAVIVATRVGDAEDLVGICGIVVPPKCPDDLASALITVLEAPVPQMRQATIARARERRRPGDMIDAHLDIYLEGANHVRHRRRG